MKTYRKDMVKLLTGFARLVNEITDDHKDFTVYGDLPAYSDEYDKYDRTHLNVPQYSIEDLADRFIDEVHFIIRNEPDYEIIDKLHNILDIIKDIDWSEI